ncbi:UDP-glucose 4-epimerase GalE [Flammeovirga aprica]|uniref:UDP-glucose 4-epimerase n=1 Tax=Flammeovirga aprica JL-4 TaxID=694437 RepID=A0A7X9NZA0_9BACT|nr:UDP-glucose 4-epimerase GalE [Flammeovirga aprica]NME66669.1 UDP-glucose 4-epimerase GalE [Flammeovirga aprica JL-4]
MSKNQVLVTGGTGYIGSHTVVELQNQGYEVVIVDDLSNSEIEVVDRIEKITGRRPFFEELNLVNESGVEALFEKYPNIGSVIHFAAFKAVGESVNEPLKYYQNNICSLINLLNSMKKHKVANMVFSSSCTVYGQPEDLPVTESAKVQPAESPYGNTKQICEEILRDTVKAFSEIKAIALRYFNPVGAHSSALIGELPKGVPQNLVPFITQTAIGLREQLSVFGDDYNTPDGSAIRDYIHVVDLAKAHIIAAERLLENKNEEGYEFFNLGTGTGSSVLEVINAFEKVNDIPVNYKIVDRREGDVEQIWADTTIANEILGWKAESGIDIMMESAWKWEQAIRKGNA